MRIKRRFTILLISSSFDIFCLSWSYSSESCSVVTRYSKITELLQNKTTRDVATRSRWIYVKSSPCFFFFKFCSFFVSWLRTNLSYILFPFWLIYFFCCRTKKSPIEEKKITMDWEQPELTMRFSHGISLSLSLYVLILSTMLSKIFQI